MNVIGVITSMVKNLVLVLMGNVEETICIIKRIHITGDHIPEGGNGKGKYTMLGDNGVRAIFMFLTECITNKVVTIGKAKALNKILSHKVLLSIIIKDHGG